MRQSTDCPRTHSGIVILTSRRRKRSTGRAVPPDPQPRSTSIGYVPASDVERSAIPSGCLDVKTTEDGNGSLCARARKSGTRPENGAVPYLQASSLAVAGALPLAVSGSRLAVARAVRGQRGPGGRMRSLALAVGGSRRPGGRDGPLTADRNPPTRRKRRCGRGSEGKRFARAWRLAIRDFGLANRLPVRYSPLAIRCRGSGTGQRGPFSRRVITR